MATTGREAHRGHPYPRMSQMPKETLGVLLAMVTLGWTGCAPAPEPPVVCDGCNVVLVIADTLRADHLASYGYARTTSPALDGFAADNLRFANARSPSACTFPSMNALLTSQPTFRFLNAETRPGIPDDIDALPTLLGEHGYATAAVSASPIVRRSPGNFNPVGGFGRGFDRFDEGCVWKGADCVNRRAKALLPTMSPPFFLYLHYMDPHDPYRPPAAFRGRFSARYDGLNDHVGAGDPNPFSAHVRGGGAPAALPSSDIDHLRDLYDESILAFDHGLAELLNLIEVAGRREDTIVVVASDHGESFLEHGRMKHCNHVHDSEIHVPLVMRIPPVIEPIVVETAASNIDIVPTLLDYLGIDQTGIALAGTSLRPWVERTSRSQSRLVYSIMGRQISATDGRFKLVLELAPRRYTLFDLRADPGETRDVSEDHPRVLRTFKIALERWLARSEPGSDDERLERGEEAEELLRSLGYLE